MKTPSLWPRLVGLWCAVVCLPWAPARADEAAPTSWFRSPAFSHVERMLEAGVPADVLLAFIRSTAGSFNLGAEQIIRLKDLGAAPEEVDAMLRHDRELSLGSWSGTPGTPVPVLSSAAAEVATASAADWFDALAPYGTWRSTAAYGWCWQPAAATDPQWRPYGTAGHWLHTERGWYWASDYPWGTYAFHYGRWFVDEEWGWCWWPDSRWAPAWVTWRTGQFICEWAPLPPGTDLAADGQGFTYGGHAVPWNQDPGICWEDYVAIPWQHFTSADPAASRLQGSCALAAWQDTAPLNNLFLSSDGLAVNRGVALGTVMQACGSIIPTTPLRLVATTGNTLLEPDQFVNENGVLTILHPTPGAVPNQTVANRTALAGLPLFSGPLPPRGPSEAMPVRASLEAWLTEADFQDDDYVPAPEQPKSAWPVRPSYPVKLTDPILVPRPYSAESANLYIIRMFRR